VKAEGYRAAEWSCDRLQLGTVELGEIKMGAFRVR
jgi:hypothetical protein